MNESAVHDNKSFQLVYKRCSAIMETIFLSKDKIPGLLSNVLNAAPNVLFYEYSVIVCRECVLIKNDNSNDGNSVC